VYNKGRHKKVTTADSKDWVERPNERRHIQKGERSDKDIRGVLVRIR